MEFGQLGGFGGQLGGFLIRLSRWLFTRLSRLRSRLLSCRFGSRLSGFSTAGGRAWFRASGGRRFGSGGCARSGSGWLTTELLARFGLSNLFAGRLTRLLSLGQGFGFAGQILQRLLGFTLCCQSLTKITVFQRLFRLGQLLQRFGSLQSSNVQGEFRGLFVQFGLLLGQFLRRFLSTDRRVWLCSVRSRLIRWHAASSLFQR